MTPTPSACVIIPARYKSSRFPGKPLVHLLGRPMVLWVASQASKAVASDHVYIATDDKRIASLVESNGFNAVPTSSTALTGTDRVAEASAQLNYDIYVNVQGDEPMVDPEDITKCIQLKTENKADILNGYTLISPDEDPADPNIPKVAITEREMLAYISRSIIPGHKSPETKPQQYLKQVCIYGFSREDLIAYTSLKRKCNLEASEDIEILRFFELERKVRMFFCRPNSLAVDVPSDVPKVEAALRSVNQ